MVPVVHSARLKQNCSYYSYFHSSIMKCKSRRVQNCTVRVRLNFTHRWTASEKIRQIPSPVVIVYQIRYFVVCHYHPSALEKGSASVPKPFEERREIKQRGGVKKLFKRIDCRKRWNRSLERQLRREIGKRKDAMHLTEAVISQNGLKPRILLRLPDRYLYKSESNWSCTSRVCLIAEFISRSISFNFNFSWCSLRNSLCKFSRRLLF